MSHAKSILDITALLSPPPPQQSPPQQIIKQPPTSLQIKQNLLALDRVRRSSLRRSRPSCAKEVLVVSTPHQEPVQREFLTRKNGAMCLKESRRKYREEVKEQRRRKVIKEKKVAARKQQCDLVAKRRNEEIKQNAANRLAQQSVPFETPDEYPLNRSTLYTDELFANDVLEKAVGLPLSNYFYER